MAAALARPAPGSPRVPSKQKQMERPPHRLLLALLVLAAQLPVSALSHAPGSSSLTSSHLGTCDIQAGLQRWQSLKPRNVLHTFDEEAAGLVDRRLSHVAAKCFPELGSNSQAKAAVQRGELTLNGAKVEACRLVRQGDVLCFDQPKPRRLEGAALHARTRFIAHLLTQGLCCLHEDEDVAVVFKPPGIHTKHATNHKFLALEDALPAILQPCGAQVPDPLPLPLAVHRLDVRVCGLLLVAKTRKASISLGRQLVERTVLKTYRALLIGTLPPGLRVADSPVDGLPAETAVNELAVTPHPQWGHVTHVELQPRTGRTHQLRVHMASLGTPIIGDDLYHESLGRLVRERMDGPTLPPVAAGRGLFLQSCEVRFEHPRTAMPIEVAVPEVAKFAALLGKARRANAYDGE